MHITASFSILADVVSNVAGDAAEVTSLIPLGADPHGYAPAPRDMVMLAEADAVFVVGANFEEALMETIKNAGEDVPLIVASSCVEIQPFGGDESEHDEHDEDVEAHEHEDESESNLHASCLAHRAQLPGGVPSPGKHIHTLGMLCDIVCDGHERETEHAHEAGSCDPHVWTDPYNVMLWTLTARDTLAALDPANADLYAANTDAYITELITLHGEITAMIDTIPPENRKLVTNHLAYGYYAHRFGLEMVGTVIPAASTLAEPSAAEVAVLIDGIKAAGVPAIFADSTANPDLAQQIAAETGAAFYALYTGSLTEADGPAPTYIDYMRVDTQIIVEALGGETGE